MILKKEISLLSSFLSKEIFFSFVGIIIILSIVILGNQLYIVSKESLKIGLETVEILPFVLYKYLGDLTEIFVISYILSFIVVFLKLKKRSEKIIIHTGGLGNFSILRVTFPIFFPFILLIFFVSFYLSPWASSQEYKYKEMAENRPAYLFLKENKFQKIGKYTFYSPSVVVTNEGQRIADVFLVTNDIQKPITIITSKFAHKITNSENAEVFLDLNNGFIFENVTTESIGKITEFNKYLVKIFDKSQSKIIHSNDPRSSMLHELLFLDNNASVAEIHYRFTQISQIVYVAIFFLLIVGINPRSKKNYSPLLTLIFYLFCFYCTIFSQTLITKGELSFFEGFIATHAIFIGIITLLYFFKKNYLVN